MSAGVAWTIKGGEVLGPAPFLVVGIVNVTADSFYDQGRHEKPSAAAAHGQKLADQGADVLDVGGESTRPGAAPVDEAAELARVLPVVRALSGRHRVSVDTVKAGVAAKALAAGAVIVNDVSACRLDPELADVVASAGCGYVLMHMQGEPRTMQDAPRYHDVVDEVRAFFEERLAHLVARGVREEVIVLDPGIGFGKTLDHNLELMRRLGEFAALGRPVYMGLSNKSWIADLLGLALDERLVPTMAATALTFAAGARIHRVHDVASARQALAVAASLA